MRDRLKTLTQGLVTVFRHPAFVVLGLVVASVTFSFALWLSNLDLLKAVLFTDTFSGSSKFTILLTSIGNIESNYHLFGRVVIISVSLLFGINAAMVIYYLKCRFVIDRAAGAGVAGTIFAMLGVGCASCGSVIVASVFGTTAVGLLPFRGLEFGLIGIAFLIFSIYLAAGKIVTPEVCKSPDAHRGESP